ncbi:MAG: CPBP family intramembrane metalloprotease [Anaerolineales bacterium]|nr:MAG: CPBP family intramembrane metalloprotease [Anaerolineales bacterium]
MIDRKGIISYLILTFGITYAIQGALILAGFRLTGAPPLYGQLVIAGVMWAPAVATILTVKLITHEGFAITNLRIGALRPYLASALVVPVCFIATYALTWLLGQGQPDWQLADLRALLAATGTQTSTMPSSALILTVVFLASLFLGPTINGIFGFGEELGWRGYLLPKLMPLGKLKAYAAVGVIWGLWHAPLIVVGFNYPGYPLLGVVGMVAMTTAIGIYINELTLRNRSSILAGWIHGAFNGQAYGVWRILFPSVNPLIGGFTGVIGIAVWLIVGLWEVHRGRVVTTFQRAW